MSALPDGFDLDEGPPSGFEIDPPSKSANKGPGRRYSAKRDIDVPMLSGVAQFFNQGITLGGADELQSVATAGVDKARGGAFGDSYSTSMRNQRREREAFQKKHPWIAAGATGLGGILPVAMTTIGGTLAGGPVGAAAGATSSLAMLRNALYGGGDAIAGVNTVAQGIKEGARYGAGTGLIAGTLSADPEKVSGLQPQGIPGINPRTFGGIEGAVTGAGIGGAVGGTMQGAKSISDRSTPMLRRAADAFGLNNVPGGSPASPLTVGGSGTTPITSAEIQILRRLNESGTSPELAMLQLERARVAGVPLGLIDVGGQPVQRLGRAVRTVPGEGSAIIDSALSNRAAGQAGRVIGNVEAGIGRVSTGNAGARSDALLGQARTNSGPLYRALDSLPPINDSRVTGIFRLPNVQRIVRQAETSGAGWGSGRQQLYDADGNISRDITFSDVNALKMSLDEVLSPMYNAGPRPAESVSVATRQEQSLVRGVRRSLLDAVDGVPGGRAYALARESYAGPAQARDAFNSGREFSRKPTEITDVQAFLREASPAERKWYERGVAESIRSRVDSVPDLSGNRNTLSSFYSNPADRAKLGAVVNPRRVGLLGEQLTMENQAAQTRNFVQGGSQTADKGAEAIGLLGDIAQDAATGRPGGVVSKALDSAMTWIRVRVSDKTNAEIARNLTSFNNPQAQIAFLKRLQNLQQQGNLRAEDVAQVARAMTINNEAK